MSVSLTYLDRDLVRLPSAYSLAREITFRELYALGTEMKAFFAVCKHVLHSAKHNGNYTI